MSNLPKKVNSWKNVINFKDLLIKEKNKDQNKDQNGAITRESTYNTTNKNNILNQLPLNNNQINDTTNKRNPSTTNIRKIKKFSKFKINKNIKSEKRLLSKCNKNKFLLLLKKSEKTKIKKKESINDIKKEDITIEPKKLRYDNYGNVINKKNKKIVHIVFADELNEKSITEEIQIESFKKFNYVKGLPKEDLINPTNPFNKCCNIY
jgi:hypothetical protein